MTTEALDYFNDSLKEQLGGNGVFTETAVFDPSGDEEIEITGVFDKNVFKNAKGNGHVDGLQTGPRFVVSEINFVFDVYADKELYLPYRNETYKIQLIEPDENGAQVLWLV